MYLYLYQHHHDLDNPEYFSKFGPNKGGNWVPRFPQWHHMHQVRRVLYGKPALALEIGDHVKDAARANDFELQVTFYDDD